MCALRLCQIRAQCMICQQGFPISLSCRKHYVLGTPQANALVSSIFHSHATFCALHVEGCPVLMAIRSGGQQC